MLKNWTVSLERIKMMQAAAKLCGVSGFGSTTGGDAFWQSFYDQAIA